MDYIQSAASYILDSYKTSPSYLTDLMFPYSPQKEYSISIKTSFCASQESYSYSMGIGCSSMRHRHCETSSLTP